MTPCLWCGRGFVARHRNAFHGAARVWAERAVAGGLLSIGDLKAAPGAFTLVGTDEAPSDMSQ
jgi:hypothetical protein